MLGKYTSCLHVEEDHHSSAPNYSTNNKFYHGNSKKYKVYQILSKKAKTPFTRRSDENFQGSLQTREMKKTYR